MNILILGGTGSIGQALTELLKNTAWNVYVTTRTRRENVQNITFLQGNAHDEKFLAECVTKEHWNVIVDFMAYSTQEFSKKVELFLESTDQYFFLSSSRVYIVKTATGAEADGVAVDVNSLVSMNMWGLTPEFLDVLEGGFKEFFKKEVPGNPLKAEYLIPIFVGELLEQGKMSVKVLRTNDTWYGMTYHEDVAAVKDSFKKMLENGVYKADLFSDL